MDPKILEQAQRRYTEGKLLSAHPAEVVHMFYQVAISSLNAAITHLKNGEAFARARSISKAEEAVAELVLSLDHSVNAPFTHALADLYAYAMRRIAEGHAKQSEQALREALSILTTLSDTWAKVKERVCEENRAADNAVEPEPEPAPQTAKVNDPYAAYSQSLPAVVGSRDWSC